MVNVVVYSTIISSSHHTQAMSSPHTGLFLELIGSHWTGSYLTPEGRLKSPRRRVGVAEECACACAHGARDVPVLTDGELYYTPRRSSASAAAHQWDAGQRRSGQSLNILRQNLGKRERVVFLLRQRVCL